MAHRKVTVQRCCDSCGESFLARAYDVAHGAGKFCSRQCQRASQARLNAKNNETGIPLAVRAKARKMRTDPAVFASHRIVSEAVKRGELVRGTCEVCGKEKVDGHHDDYSKPLAVRWLCRKHHLAHHRGR